MRAAGESDRPLAVDARDRPDAPVIRQPLAIVLDNLRSAYNVGNIFRLADTCAVRFVAACGYTARPPHVKLAKTARGCDQRVPCRHYDTCAEAVRTLREEGYWVVAVETVTAAAPAWETPLRWPAAFVFGNEAHGIDPEVLSACDACTRLPVFGCKNSLNVANCAAAVLYCAIRRLSESDREPPPQSPASG